MKCSPALAPPAALAPGAGAHSSSCGSAYSSGRCAPLLLPPPAAAMRWRCSRVGGIMPSTCGVLCASPDVACVPQRGAGRRGPRGGQGSCSPRGRPTSAPGRLPSAARSPCMCGCSCTGTAYAVLVVAPSRRACGAGGGLGPPTAHGVPAAAAADACWLGGAAAGCCCGPGSSSGGREAGEPCCSCCIGGCTSCCCDPLCSGSASRGRGVVWCVAEKPTAAWWMLSPSAASSAPANWRPSALLRLCVWCVQKCQALPSAERERDLPRAAAPRAATTRVCLRHHLCVQLPACLGPCDHAAGSATTAPAPARPLRAWARACPRSRTPRMAQAAFGRAIVAAGGWQACACNRCTAQQRQRSSVAPSTQHAHALHRWPPPTAHRCLPRRHAPGPGWRHGRGVQRKHGRDADGHQQAQGK